MKRLLWALIFLASSYAAAQYRIPVTGSNISDSGGYKLQHGVICFEPNQSPRGPATSYRVGGGGQVSAAPACTPVTNGAFTLSLPDTSQTNPENVCFNVTVVGNYGYGRDSGYGCVQPAANRAPWCGPTSCNFDDYIPDIPAIGVGGTGPTGPQGPPGAGFINGLTSDGTDGINVAGNANVGGDVNAGGNANVTGNVTAAGVNGALNAAKFSGSDIGAKANAAFASCSWACPVIIPAGTYSSVTTSISIPLNVTGDAALYIQGAVNYTGSGCFVDTYEVSGSPVASNLTIKFEGGQIIGTSSGKCGIHLLPTNGISIFNPMVRNFSTGDGIADEGSILVSIFGGQLLGNYYDLHMYGTKCQTSSPYTCGPSPSGTTLPYTPNKTNVYGTILGNAVAAAAYIDGSVSGTGEVLSTFFNGVDFEGNTATGLDCGKSQGTTVINPYFEANGTHNLTAHDGCNNLTVINPWITTTGAIPYSIELVDANYATIIGADEGGSTPSSCTVNTSISSNVLRFHAWLRLHSLEPLREWIFREPHRPDGNR